MEEERKAVEINRTEGDVVRVPADGDGADAPSDSDKDAALPPPELQDPPKPVPPKDVKPERLGGKIAVPAASEVKPSNESSK